MRDRILIPTPERRPSLAQRFSAEKNGPNDSNPGGTIEITLLSFAQTTPALPEINSPRPTAKTQQGQSKGGQRQRKLESARARQAVLEMHLPDGHAHLDHKCE